MADVYQQYYYLHGEDNVLRRRLTGACIHQRNLIRKEAGNVALHAKRLTWATAVETFNQAQAMADKVLLDILADPVMAANPLMVGDADPDGRLYFIFDNTNAGNGALGILRVEANLDAYVA